MPWITTPEVYAFDKQIVLEWRKREIIKDFWSLIDSFIITTTKDSEAWINFKDWFLEKVKNELKTPEERKILTDYIEEQMRNSSWDNKLQFVELWARVWNIWKNIEGFTKVPEYKEEIPFEIAGWSITKKVLTKKEWWKWYELTTEYKTYQITWWDIENIWNNTYRVYLEWKRKVWKYWSSWTNEYIDIKYNWWNTIQILDNYWESIWIVPIRNKREISIDGGHRRQVVRERNSFISFELKNSWSKIEIELSFPNR